MPLVILYHSVYGHTARVAQAVAEGAGKSGAEIMLIRADEVDEAAWGALDAASAIIFGSPTYMGGVTATFKGFIDSTSKRWIAQRWKDKIAAGFINAGSLSGDNVHALNQLLICAMQHSMIWVGAGIMPHQFDDHHVNRLGGFTGLLTQSDNETPDVTPPAGDLATAKLFGARVAQITARLQKQA
ncbi:MAG: flavodoxin family protein [Alphaproteobacteria bacterium]|nr:flavodoxin family protein [Alphaproteobacteria bacterium]